MKRLYLRSKFIMFIARWLNVPMDIHQSYYRDIPNVPASRAGSGMDVVYRHPQSGTTGPVEATSTDPAGKNLFRIKDHWFMSDELVHA